MRKKEYVRQIDILRAIKIHEPVTGPQLADMFNRTRQAIHMRLKLMERRGLIEKVVPEQDAPIIPVRYRCSGMLRELEQRMQREQSEED